MTARVALTDIQNTALHEAAHATVSAYLGAQVSRIAIWAVHGGGFEGVVDYFSDDTTLFDNAAIATAGRAVLDLINPAANNFEVFGLGIPRETIHGENDWRAGVSAPAAKKVREEIADGTIAAVRGVAHEMLADDRKGDLDRAHLWIDQIRPAPQGVHRWRILRLQWERAREILRPRFAGVASLADALVSAYEAAEQRAFTPGCQIRAEISGAELARLLAFAR